MPETRDPVHSLGGAIFRLVCFAAALDPLACSKVLGVADYRVSPPQVAACDALSVPLKTGGCGIVGALGCPNGFEIRDGECLPYFHEEACEPGFRAGIGETGCKSVDVACSSSGFGVFHTGGIYVQQAASGTGDDPSSPLPTIAQGIARAKLVGATNVWIASGTYAEDGPLVIDAPIQLNGTCASAVTIQGQTGAPVVEFREGATSGGLSLLSITGGSMGVQITGTSGVKLATLWIHDVAGPGVVVEGAFDTTAKAPGGLLLSDGGLRADARAPPDDAGAGPAVGASLDYVTIERASGAGVEVWGSNVTLSDVVIRDISSVSELLPGRGIGVHPSPISYPSWQPRRSKVDISRTAITNVHSTGIFIEGSDGSVEGSLVAHVLPDASGRGAGVVVQPRIATNVFATLAAKNTLIEHTSDVGVKVWSSRTTLDTVTVRDTGESSAVGNCSGNGLRVRLDSTADRVLSAPPLEGPLVQIHHSVFERTRESAVHVEGARVDIEDSILRGTMKDTCDAAYGDGVAAYSFPERQADVRVTRTRIDDSARASVASFGARTSVAESAFGCNAQGPTKAGTRSTFTADAVSGCGCGGAWSSCSANTETALRPALHGAMGCESGDACISLCLTDWFGNIGVTRLPGATVWVDGDDRRAPAFTSKAGCVALGGATGSLNRLGVSGQDYLFALSSAGSWTSRDYGLVPIPSFSAHMLFMEGTQTYGEQFDFRTGYLVSAFACDAVAPNIDGEPQEGCDGHGIPGVRFELVGHPGRAVYDSENFATDRARGATTVAGGVNWMNVSPGDHELLVYPPPDSATLACSVWSGGGAPSASLPGGSPVRAPIRVSPGAATVLWLDCKRPP